MFLELEVPGGWCRSLPLVEDKPCVLVVLFIAVVDVLESATTWNKESYQQKSTN
jgi:hypothetical protein